MKIEDQNNRMNHSDPSFLSGEENELQIVSVSIGTFADTQKRLFLVRDGKWAGIISENQGSGQN
jgi:hypothetical protein